MHVAQLWDVSEALSAVCTGLLCMAALAYCTACHAGQHAAQLCTDGEAANSRTVPEMLAFIAIASMLFSLK